MAKPSAQECNEIIFFLEDRFTNIANLKRYQWEAAYYAVALLAGLLAIAQTYDEISLLPRFLVMGASCFVAIAWALINRTLFDALRKTRESKDSLVRRLSTVTEAVKRNKPDHDTIGRVLGILVVGSSAFVVLLVWYG